MPRQVVHLQRLAPLSFPKYAGASQAALPRPRHTYTDPTHAPLRTSTRVARLERELLVEHRQHGQQAVAVHQVAVPRVLLLGAVHATAEVRRAALVNLGRKGEVTGSLRWVLDIRARRA